MRAGGESVQPPAVTKPNLLSGSNTTRKSDSANPTVLPWSFKLSLIVQTSEDHAEDLVLIGSAADIAPLKPLMITSRKVASR